VTADPATLEQSRKAVAVQQSLGVPTEVLGPREIGRHLPCLVTDDLVGGTFCEADGSADPYGMLQGFLAIARSRGLHRRGEEPAIGFARDGDRATGVRTPTGTIAAPVVINCAGPYADQVGMLAGVAIPSRPYRRQVMVTEPLPVLPEVFPLVVDLDTGFYVHRQGRTAVLMGGTDKDIKPGLDTTVDWEAFDAVFRAAGRRGPAAPPAPGVPGAP